MSTDMGGVKRRGGGGDADGESKVGTIRESINSVTQQLLPMNERILNEVFNKYWDTELGLLKIGQKLDIPITHPRRKVTVLILGNHSAGKSSFINWYVEETVLKTGVAIETPGFSFVTSGKRRDTLMGQATIKLYPHLRAMMDMPGVVEYLTTEVCTSRSKKFPLVTFIDTPGLVDGDMNYPFDVNETLLWLGGMADLVFVFFDPMGQALCRRTLNILESMWTNHSEKVRLYLAKSDEAGTEIDRQKVLMQIVQELCKRPHLNRAGFSMPTIYLPNSYTGKTSKCANQIDEVCQEIERFIDQTVQTSLNNFEVDCKTLKEEIVNRLTEDDESLKRNAARSFKTTALGLVGMFLPFLLLLTVIVANSKLSTMQAQVGPVADVLKFVLDPVAKKWLETPSAYHFNIVVFVVLVSAVCLMVSRFVSCEYVLPKGERKDLEKSLDIVNENLSRWQTLYKEYLQNSLSETDYVSS